MCAGPGENRLVRDVDGDGDSHLMHQTHRWLLLTPLRGSERGALTRVSGRIVGHFDAVTQMTPRAAHRSQSPPPSEVVSNAALRNET